MDQHPVPQNVTTFQFRLIGDMTIKQFGYLAGGAILAFISYKLPLPFFFSWPLTIIFALGGVGFAFVPIEERPMDVWVLSFLKNVYSPTIFTWEQTAQQKTPLVKQSAGYEAHNTSPVSTMRSQPTGQAREPHGNETPRPVESTGEKTTASVVGTMYSPLNASLTHSQTVNQQPQSTPGMYGWIFDLFKPKAYAPQIQPAAPVQAPHMATPSVVGSHLDISMPPTVAKKHQDPSPIVEPIKPITVQPSQDAQISQQTLIEDKRISDLQKQLADALAQKEKLSQDMNILKSQQSHPTPISIPSHPQPQHVAQQANVQQVPVQPQAQKQPTVKIITQEGAVRAGLPRLTTFPNVVTGITKDSDNNFLPGVLVTVKDKEGIPVRALKTNRLGQFAASTPLSNGVYFVEIEDPRQRYTFDRVQITLNGSIVPALEIITKSQKQITRDKLAKELFGTTQ